MQVKIFPQDGRGVLYDRGQISFNWSTRLLWMQDKRTQGLDLVDYYSKIWFSELSAHWLKHFFSKQGLDFSNSYLVPESGHPLEQEQVRKRPREEEDEEQRRVMMSPVVRSKMELVEEEEKKVVVTKKREEEEERRMEKREVVLQPVPSTQGWQTFQINCMQRKHPLHESHQNQLQASSPRSSLCPPAPNRTTSCRSAAWCSRATPPWWPTTSATPAWRRPASCRTWAGSRWQGSPPPLKEPTSSKEVVGKAKAIYKFKLKCKPHT